MDGIKIYLNLPNKASGDFHFKHAGHPLVASNLGVRDKTCFFLHISDVTDRSIEAFKKKILHVSK